MLRIVKMLVVALALAASAAILPSSQAAWDIDADVGSQTAYELLVLEVEGCIYCQLFRRDVVPGYEASDRGKSVPLRFIDLNHASLDAFQLAQPVVEVPTVVLVKERHEIGRISGYVGPEPFYHAVNHLMARAAPKAALPKQ